MPRFLRAVLLVIAVFVSLGVVCKLFLRTPAPIYEGRIECPELRSEVRIKRDVFGVPHIFASDRYDLFFAQGFVVAQDRLWQMDFFRRVARGRLSQVVGRKAALYDSLFLTLHLAGAAERAWDEAGPESRELLQAYADGVNACIREKGDRLPLEFALLGYKPSPWRPQDTLVISRLLAWVLSMGWLVDPVYNQLVDSLGFAKVAEIEPEPGALARSPRYARTAISVRWSGWSRFSMLCLGGAHGSNNWAVAGSKSRSGKPLLANDPHLPFLSPGFWYMMSLSGAGYEVVGASIPGLPGIIVGRNRAVAWGVTNGMVDDVDFFLEKLSEDSTRCVGPQGTEAVRTVWDTLFVKGREPMPFRVLITPRGPLVSPLLKDTTRAISLSWTGFQASDEIRAFDRLSRSRNVEEAIAALRDYLAPAQNFVLADTLGNVAYKLAGKVPERRWPGVLLRRAWLPEDQWQGWIPYEAMPQQVNPPEGFVASANYIPPGAIDYISCYWEPSGRIDRIRQLLQDGEGWDVEGFRQMQLDTVSTFALHFLDRALRWIPEDSLDRRQKDFLLLLRQWDGDMGRESLEAAVYASFLLKSIECVFKDEMGDSLYARFAFVPNVPLRVLSRLLEDGRSSWFDDVTTDRRETVSETMLRAWREALDFLENKLGKNVGKWRWGSLHQLTFRHPLAENWVAAQIFNAGGFPHPGSICTINNGAFALRGDFSAIVGPSLRMVADLAETSPSVAAVEVPGQCEIPRTHYFANLIEVWRKGQLVPIALEVPRTAKARVLVLTP